MAATAISLTACGAVWPDLRDPKADADASFCEYKAENDTIAEVRACASTLRDTLVKLSQEGERFDRGTTYALFGTATASGAGLVFGAPTDFVKGTALAAATIFGARETVNVKEQRRIFKKGFQAINCVLEYEDGLRLVDEKANERLTAFVPASRLTFSVANSPGTAVNVPQLKPRSLMDALTKTASGGSNRMLMNNQGGGTAAPALTAQGIRKLEYAAALDLNAKTAAEQINKVLREQAPEGQRIILLRQAIANIRFEMLQSLAESVDPEQVFANQQRRALDTVSTDLGTRNTLRNNQGRLPNTTIDQADGDGTGEAEAVDKELTATVNEALAVTAPAQRYAQCSGAGGGDNS
ncbi:MAG: hypothetical protein ACK4FJ_18020 [Ferrovibrio sp.]|uniref:hypothetical protein n=1 Tax=Ferrovibrio sp. TaxID=1917215 RepID=UPI00391CF79B